MRIVKDVTEGVALLVFGILPTALQSNAMVGVFPLHADLPEEVAREGLWEQHAGWSFGGRLALLLLFWLHDERRLLLRIWGFVEQVFLGAGELFEGDCLGGFLGHAALRLAGRGAIEEGVFGRSSTHAYELLLISCAADFIKFVQLRDTLTVELTILQVELMREKRFTPVASPFSHQLNSLTRVDPVYGMAHRTSFRGGRKLTHLSLVEVTEVRARLTAQHF